MTLAEAIPSAEVAAYWLEYLGRFGEVYPYLDLAAAAARIERLAEAAPEPSGGMGMEDAVRDILAAKAEAENLHVRPYSTPRRDRAERAEAERRLRARRLGIPVGAGRSFLSEEGVLEWEQRLQGGEA